MLEKLLTLPGFIYEADGAYYYLGKWICKECTNVDETDCVTMYQMCRAGGEEKDASFYLSLIHISRGRVKIPSHIIFHFS